MIKKCYGVVFLILYSTVSRLLICHARLSNTLAIITFSSRLGNLSDRGLPKVIPSLGGAAESFSLKPYAGFK
jgi:hypothetical protein